MDKFKEDLENGKTTEKFVADAYSAKVGSPAIMAKNDYWTPWDFRIDLRNDLTGSFEKRIEVKDDLYAQASQKKYGADKTNLFFEVSSSGKTSGFINSLADEWAHVVGDIAYVFDIRELRRLFIKEITGTEKIGRMTRGGDRNAVYGWLVPLPVIIKKASFLLKIK